MLYHTVLTFLYLTECPLPMKLFFSIELPPTNSTNRASESYGNDFPFGLFVSDSSNLLILSNFISLKCLPKICQCLWNLAQMSSSGFIVLHSNCVSHDSNFYPTLVKAIASWVFLSPSQLPTLTILLFLPGVTFSSMTSDTFLPDLSFPSSGIICSSFMAHSTFYLL